MNTKDRFPSIEDKTAREEGDIFAPAFDAHGLIPAIVTSAVDGSVLMFAYMNQTALARSIETGEAHFWSRSRQALWRKGDTSGNTLRILEMRTDCDQDVLWLKVDIAGSGACCHTGRVSCFYRKVPVGGDVSQKLVNVDSGRRFDPEDVYGRKPAAKGTFAKGTLKGS